MKDKNKVEPERTRDHNPEKPPEKKKDESEFKVTVRKLDVPVRPRGVLAD